MKINEELGRFETHYTTMVKLITNLLDANTEEQTRTIVLLALEEAVEIKKQEQE